MHEHRTIEYRPQLDGLRAIAVALVFVFHAVPSQLSGGFIGVDIFFVLSGYLITLILLDQAERRRSGMLRHFYVHRIRRLLPASLALLVAVALHEALWGSVLELSTRLREIRATTLYVANWHLIGQADDYFVETAGASPLRHMWSLAVEEQFYFVWPVLVVLALRWGRPRLVGMAVLTTVLAGVSVAAMLVLYSPSNVVRAYYGTDARVFQPLLGALLAVWSTSRSSRHTGAARRRSVALAATGAGIVALGIIAVMAFTMSGSKALYFRGGAVAVGLVACAAIFALERSPALATVIGCSPLAALGRISYGFYLWHWPIILWIRPAVGAGWTDRRLVNLTQLLATLAVSTASYVLVERPIRSSRSTVPSGLVFTGAAVAMAITIGSSNWLLRPVTGGFADVATAAAADHSAQACPDDPQPCVMYEPGDPTAATVVIAGDSTMQMYRPAMMVLAEQYGFRLVQAAVGGCPIGDRLIATGINGDLNKPSNFTCYDAIPGIYASVLEQWPPSLVIATSINEGAQHVTNGELVAKGTPRHVQEMKAALVTSVDALTSTGADLVLIDVLPAGPSVDCLDASAPNTGGCARPVPDPPTDSDVNGVFAELAEQRDAVRGVIDFTSLICPGGSCPLTIDGEVVRYDGRHFTGTWSASMAPRLDEQLRALGVDLSRL